MSVTKFPGKFQRAVQLRGDEIWAAPKPTDFMVWEVCPYLRNLEPCQGCAEWEEDERFGTVKVGCRALAEEACRVVLASSSRS